MDEESFESMMRGEGVKPLKQGSDKVNLKDSVSSKASSKQGQNFSVKRQAAERHEPQSAALSDSTLREYGPYDILEFKRHGIQHGTFKNLKQGKMEVEAELDLHRHTVAKAREALWQFIAYAQYHHYCCVLIQHGKGYHSEQASESKPVSVLKSHVADWLTQMDGVQAYSSAQPRDGGTGAVYVLVKKGIN